MDGNSSNRPASGKLVKRWSVLGLAAVLVAGLWVVRDYSNASGAPNVAMGSAETDGPPKAARPSQKSNRIEGVELPAAKGPQPATSQAGPSRSAASPAGRSESPAESEDEVISRQIVGTWKLDDSIKRVIEIRPDGTATMQVKLDYFSSLLYGAEMTLDLKWDVHDGVLTHHLEKGQPEANVRRLIHDWGNERSYKVVNVTPDEMVLESVESHDVHDWKRVETGAPAVDGER